MAADQGHPYRSRHHSNDRHKYTAEEYDRAGEQFKAGVELRICRYWLCGRNCQKLAGGGFCEYMHPRYINGRDMCEAQVCRRWQRQGCVPGGLCDRDGCRHYHGYAQALYEQLSDHMRTAGVLLPSKVMGNMDELVRECPQEVFEAGGVNMHLLQLWGKHHR